MTDNARMCEETTGRTLVAITLDQIIFHRGLHDMPSKRFGAEENTIEAFERAIGIGATMIEFDVWDNLRITHDPGNSNAPTLTEALAAIDGRCSVNIEIKSPRARVDVQEIVRQAISSGRFAPEQFVLSSFHHKTAALIKREFVYLRVGAIIDAVPLPAYVLALENAQIDQLHIEWMNALMDIEGMFAFRDVVVECGMKLWAWTINDKPTAELLLRYGAERIFTDRPDLLLAEDAKNPAV